MFKFFAAALLVIISDTALAISNIESRRPLPPKEGWSGQLELTANGKSGNVEEDRFGLGARLVLKQEDDTFFALATKSHHETLGLKTADQAFVHGRWIHQKTERAALEGFVQWQEDEFSNLLSRYLAGGGGRFDVLMVPDEYSLTLGIGAFREWERSNLGTYIDESENWRFNAYWSYKHQLNEQVNWYNTTYAQPSLDSSDDYRLLFEMGLAVRLSQALHLLLFYSLLHDSQPARNLAVTPAIDAKETNTQYSTSFVYEF